MSEASIRMMWGIGILSLSLAINFVGINIRFGLDRIAEALESLPSPATDRPDEQVEQPKREAD